MFISVKYITFSDSVFIWIALGMTSAVFSFLILIISVHLMVTWKKIYSSLATIVSWVTRFLAPNQPLSRIFSYFYSYSITNGSVMIPQNPHVCFNFSLFRSFRYPSQGALIVWSGKGHTFEHFNMSTWLRRTGQPLKKLPLPFTNEGQGKQKHSNYM